MDDPQPLLSEATFEELSDEIHRRFGVFLVAALKDRDTTNEDLKYYFGGSPLTIIGIAKTVASELVKDLILYEREED